MFCSGNIGAYDSNKYYFPSPNGAKLVGKKWNFSSTDTASVKSILKKGDIGDLIQVRRRGKSYGHTMIMVGKDSKGIYIFDCNSDGKCSVRCYYQTYTDFAAKNIGMSLYHSTKYPSKKPSEPKITSVSATGDTEITIKWNSVAGAEKYILQGRKAGGTYETIAELGGTSYVHKNLDSASLYWYHVKAQNSSGSSSYSDANAAYTKPKTPTASTLSASSIKVNWSSSGGDTVYELLARKAGDADYKTIAENLSGFSYTHTGLDAGSQYYYKIKAHNKEHTSIISGRSDSGYGYTKLNAPKITAKTSNSVSISWSKGPMNSEYTYTYRIYRKAANASAYSNIAVVTGTSYTDSPLEPNTSYSYYIDVLRNGSACVSSYASDVTTSVQNPEKIQLSQSEIALAPGQTYQLSANILPANTTDKTVTWLSSNADIAAVSNGLVSAKALGSALITAKASNGLTAVCTVKAESAENLCTHSFGEYVITKPAGCTAAGERTRTCSKCLKSETEIIPAEGHNFSEEWTIITAPSCSAEGIQKHLCTKCTAADESTAETIDMLKHSAGDEWITEKEPTCTESGVKYKACTICGAHTDTAEIPALSHEYVGIYISVQPASCTQIGIEYCTCVNCNEKQYRYIDRTPHDYNITETKRATADSSGYAVYTCSVCHDTYTEILDPDPDIISCGNISSSIEWTLYADGTLELSGSGSMEDYQKAGDTPWFADRLTVKNIIIGDRITSIGARAFYGCINCEGISIPDSVSDIGTYALKDCDIITIYANSDSYAHEFSTKNNIDFEPSDKEALREITLENFSTSKVRHYFYISVSDYTDDADVYAALFSKDGSMIAAEKTALISDDITSVSLPVSAGSSYVRIYVWKNNSMIPVTDFKEIPIQ